MKIFDQVKKPISCVVIFTFAVFSILEHAPRFAYAESAPSPSLSHEGRGEGELRSIPSDLGTVERSKVPGTSGQGPTVYYIQDAHNSLEAQENIAKLIDHLAQTQGVRQVYIEGYDGNDAGKVLDQLYSSQGPEVKLGVSRFFLDHLRLSGAHFGYINRKTDLQLMGIESAQDYLNNLRSYEDAAKTRAETGRSLDVIVKYLKTLADRLYPKEIQEYQKLKERFEGKQLELGDYVFRIMKLGEAGTVLSSSRTVPKTFTSRYPHLSLVAEYLNKTQLTPAEQKELNEKLKTIDHRVFFDELERFEEGLVRGLLGPDPGHSEHFQENISHGTGSDSVARETFRYQEKVALLMKLNQLQLTPEEYDELAPSPNLSHEGRGIPTQPSPPVILSGSEGSRDSSASPQNDKDREVVDEGVVGLTAGIAHFLAKNLKKPIVFNKEWETDIQEALRFYEWAKKRDENFKKKLGKPTAPLILVTGGFHAGPLTRFFEKENISYVLIAPKITKEDPLHEKRYDFLMSGGHYPFEPSILKPAAASLMQVTQPLQVQQAGVEPVAEMVRAASKALKNGQVDPKAFEAIIRTEHVLEASQKVMGASLGLVGGSEEKGRAITKADVAAALKEIHQKAGRTIFEGEYGERIVEKVSQMDLIQGKNVLIVGPGTTDYLPILIAKLGMKVTLVETGPESLEEEQDLIQAFDLQGQVESLSSYAGMDDRAFDYVFLLAVLHRAQGNSLQVHTMAAPLLAFLYKKGGYLFINDLDIELVDAGLNYLDQIFRADEKRYNVRVEQRPRMDLDDFSMHTAYIGEPRRSRVYHIIKQDPSILSKILGEDLDPGRQAAMIEQIQKAYREIKPEEEILIGELSPLANLENGMAYGRLPRPDGSKGKPFYLGTGERINPGATLAVAKAGDEIVLIIRYQQNGLDQPLKTARLFWRNGDFVREAELQGAPLEEKKGEFIQGLREAYQTMKAGETRYFEDISSTADMTRGLLHRRFPLPDGKLHPEIHFALERKGPYVSGSLTLAKESERKFIYRFNARSANGGEIEFFAVWQDGKYSNYAEYLRTQISRAYEDLKKGRITSAKIGDITPLVDGKTGLLDQDFPFMPKGARIKRDFGAGKGLRSISLEIAENPSKKYVFEFTYLKQGSENFEKVTRVWDGRKLIPADGISGASLGTVPLENPSRKLKISVGVHLTTETTARKINREKKIYGTALTVSPLASILSDQEFFAEFKRSLTWIAGFGLPARTTRYQEVAGKTKVADINEPPHVFLVANSYFDEQKTFDPYNPFPNNGFGTSGSPTFEKVILKQIAFTKDDFIGKEVDDLAEIFMNKIVVELNEIAASPDLNRPYWERIRDARASGASLGGKPQLSLEEAKELFKWVLSNAKDDSYSFRLAEETLKRPIHNILMIGGGLTAYPFLMALTGKNVIVIEKDPDSIERYRRAIDDLKILMDEYGIQGTPELWVFRWPDDVPPDYLSDKVGPSAIDLVTFIDIASRKDFSASADQWMRTVKVWASPSAYLLIDERASGENSQFRKAFPKTAPAAPGRNFKGNRQKERSKNRLYQLVSDAAGALDFFRDKDWKGTYAADALPALKNGFLAIDGNLKKMEEQFIPKDPKKIVLIKRSEIEAYEQSVLDQYRVLSDSLQHIVPGDIFLNYYRGNNLLVAYLIISERLYGAIEAGQSKGIPSTAVASYIRDNYILLAETQALLKDQAVRGRSLGNSTASELPFQRVEWKDPKHIKILVPEMIKVADLLPLVEEFEKLGKKVEILDRSSLYSDPKNFAASGKALQEIIVKESPDVLIVRSDTMLKDDKKAPNRYLLDTFASAGGKLILRAGVGYDSIDAEYAETKGVHVAVTYGNAVSVAELAVRSMAYGAFQGRAPPASVDLAEKYPQIFKLAKTEFVNAEAASPRGKADEKTKVLLAASIDPGTFANFLSGKTVGLVGFGNIAQPVAGKLRSLETVSGLPRGSFRIKAFSKSLLAGKENVLAPAQQMGVEGASFDEILRTSDIVSLHLPLTSETKGIIDLENVKPLRGKILVNTSRAGLVTPEAVRDLVEHGGSYFAEFSTGDLTLDSHPNVYVTPHIAASTASAKQGVADNTVKALDSAIAGRLDEVIFVNRVPFALSVVPVLHPDSGQASRGADLGIDKEMLAAAQESFIATSRELLDQKDRMPYEEWKNGLIGAYGDLIERTLLSIETGGRESVFVYPFMGADIIPALFRKTIAINNDPADVGELGMVEIAPVFGEGAKTRVLKNALNWHESLNALDPQSYDSAIEDPAPHILILKGFSRFGIKAGRESVLKMLDYLLVRVLRRGDKILVLDTVDLDLLNEAFETLPEDIRSQFSQVSDGVRLLDRKGEVVFPAGYKIFAMPNMVSLIEKTSGASLGEKSPRSNADAYLPRIAQALKTIAKELEKLGKQFIPKDSAAKAIQVNFNEVTPFEKNIRSQFHIVSDALQHVVPGDKMTDLIDEGSVKNRYDVIYGHLSLTAHTDTRGESKVPSTALAVYYAENFALIQKVVNVIESHHTEGKSLGEGLKREFEKDIASDKRFEIFRTHDFRENGPQSATRYYTEFKAWYNGLKEREDEIDSSRDEALKQLFKKATERYSYVVAKIVWIWHLEGLGVKIRSLQDKEDADGAKQAADDLLKRHENFMANHPNAPFLQNDPSVKTALKDVYRLLGITEPKPAIIPAKPAETVRSTPDVKGPAVKVEVTGARAPPAVPAKIDLKKLAIVFTAALALSAVFYVILPVNLFTVSLAFILPLALFIIFKTSWPIFLLSLGFSVALATFLPIPWLGLSLAAIAITQFFFSPARSAERRAPGEASSIGTEKGPALKEAEILSMYQKRSGALPLSTDVMSYVLRIAALMAAGRSATRADLEKIDLRFILDALFQVRPSELIPEDGALKERLKPLVRAKIQSLELGFDISALEHIRKLKHWPQENKDNLARALQEITGEIARDLSPQLAAKDADQAPLAIQEIIAEYFRIDKERFMRIQLSLMLLLVREKIESDRIIGVTSAENLYLEGRIEFFFKNYRIAGQAFGSAARLEPSNAHYLLTAGIVDHYLKKWEQAQVFYKRSLDIREQVKQPAEIEKLKLELNRLLLQKAKAKVPLEGSDSEKVKGASLGATKFEESAEKYLVIFRTGAYELVHLAGQFNKNQVFVMREDVGEKKKVRITSTSDIDILGLSQMDVANIRLIVEGPGAQDAVDGIYHALNSRGVADEMVFDKDRLTPELLKDFIEESKRSVSTEAFIKSISSLEDVRKVDPAHFDEVWARLAPEDQEFFRGEEEWVKNNRAPPKMLRIPVDALLKPAPERTPEDIRTVREYQAADQARVRWQAHVENVWYPAPMFADKGAVADAQIAERLVPILDKPLTDKPWIDSETPIMLAKRGEEIEPMYRVLTPKARDLLWDLVVELRMVEFQGEPLLSKEKLVITSLTRDSEKQDTLNQTEGVTANLKSTHGLGEAFDIWLSYFKNPSAQESEEVKGRLLAHYDALMITLNRWKKEGQVNLIIEYEGTVAHVARNPHFVTGSSLGSAAVPAGDWEEVLKELRIDDQRGGKTIFGKPIVAWLDTYIPEARRQLGSHLVKYFVQDTYEEKENRNRFDGWIRYHETIKHWERMKAFIVDQYARNIPHEASEVRGRLAEMTVDTMILARAHYLSKHKRRYQSKVLSAATPEGLKKAKRLKAYLYKAVNSEAWKKLGEYRLWNLPIWSVDAKGIRMDLMKWVHSYPDAPPEEWYDPAYLKSLAQITGSREPIERPKPPAEPRQLTLFDDLSKDTGGKGSTASSLGRATSRIKIHGVVLDATLDKSLRNLLKMQKDISSTKYDISDLETLKAFMRSKAALRDDLGSASDSLRQVVPGDDMVEFLKKGAVLEQYWDILERLYGGHPTAQTKFEPSREMLAAYVADSLTLVREIIGLVEHARGRAERRGSPIPEGKRAARDRVDQVRIAGVVIEDIRLDLQKIEEFFIKTTYDPANPLRLDDLIEFEVDISDNFDVLAEMLALIVLPSEKTGVQAIRYMVSRYREISDQLANSADATKREVVTKKALSAYVKESRSLLRQANSLVKPFRVKGSSLGADMMEEKLKMDDTRGAGLDKTDITKLIDEMTQPVPVFVDMTDYSKFSDKQRNEFLMLALQKKIKAVIYNDTESRVNADPNLVGLKNVISYRGDAAGAFAAYGQVLDKKIIHLSREADAREKLSRDRFYFFRQAGEEAGALLAALLYQLSDGKLRGVEEKGGFLVVDIDSALLKLVQEYEASFEIAKAA